MAGKPKDMAGKPKIIWRETGKAIRYGGKTKRHYVPYVRALLSDARRAARRAAAAPPPEFLQFQDHQSSIFKLRYLP